MNNYYTEMANAQRDKWHRYSDTFKKHHTEHNRQKALSAMYEYLRISAVAHAWADGEQALAQAHALAISARAQATQDKAQHTAYDIVRESWRMDMHSAYNEYQRMAHVARAQARTEHTQAIQAQADKAQRTQRTQERKTSAYVKQDDIFKLVHMAVTDMLTDTQKDKYRQAVAQATIKAYAPVMPSVIAQARKDITQLQAQADKAVKRAQLLTGVALDDLENRDNKISAQRARAQAVALCDELEQAQAQATQAETDIHNILHGTDIICTMRLANKYDKALNVARAEYGKMKYYRETGATEFDRQAYKIAVEKYTQAQEQAQAHESESMRIMFTIGDNGTDKFPTHSIARAYAVCNSFARSARLDVADIKCVHADIVKCARTIVKTTLRNSILRQGTPNQWIWYYSALCGEWDNDVVSDLVQTACVGILSYYDKHSTAHGNWIKKACAVNKARNTGYKAVNKYLSDNKAIRAHAVESACLSLDDYENIIADNNCKIADMETYTGIQTAYVRESYETLKDMLTDTERTTLDNVLYCNNNITAIAKLMNVSKQAVADTMIRIRKKWYTAMRITGEGTIEYQLASMATWLDDIASECTNTDADMLTLIAQAHADVAHLVSHGMTVKQACAQLDISYTAIRKRIERAKKAQAQKQA